MWAYISSEFGVAAFFSLVTVFAVSALISLVAFLRRLDGGSATALERWTYYISMATLALFGLRLEWLGEKLGIFIIVMSLGGCVAYYLKE